MGSRPLLCIRIFKTKPLRAGRPVRLCNMLTTSPAVYPFPQPHENAPDFRAALPAVRTQCPRCSTVELAAAEAGSWQRAELAACEGHCCWWLRQRCLWKPLSPDLSDNQMSPGSSCSSQVARPLAKPAGVSVRTWWTGKNPEKLCLECQDLNWEEKLGRSEQCGDAAGVSPMPGGVSHPGGGSSSQPR